MDTFSGELEDAGYLDVGDWGNEVARAEALQAWKSQTDEEIDLEVGDFVAVESRGSGNGWWVGTNIRTGDAGLFPGSYVSEIAWSPDEIEVLEYNDELCRLADELGEFEGDGGESEGGGDGVPGHANAALLLDAVHAELALLVPLAVGAGFCDTDSLDDEDILLYFTRQVVAGIVVRSAGEVDDGVVLLNGAVTSAMFDGVHELVLSNIERGAVALDTVPPERSQLAAEQLQRAFGSKSSDSDISNVIDKLGDTGMSAVDEGILKVQEAAAALLMCPGFKSRWGGLVLHLQTGRDPKESHSVITTATSVVRKKISLVKAFARTALAGPASRLGITASHPDKKSATEVKSRRTSTVRAVLGKAATTAYTASLLAMYKVKTHAQSYNQRKKRPTKPILVAAAKTRESKAPELPPS